MSMQNQQICKRCVMDASDPAIVFDAKGICNHCKSYYESTHGKLYLNRKDPKVIEEIVQTIKRAGQGRDYDCIVGVSGGVDSSYTIYMAIKLGLRPLAVHMDNGWNSDLAISNIESLLKKLDVDLYTYVIDWEVFRDLQLSFLKASTPDTELPTDHAIRALLLKVAAEKGIKHILNGRNLTTEGILPFWWGYGPFDWKYIKSIQRLFGKSHLNGYPHLSIPSLFYNMAIRRVKDVSILNYLPYNKKEAIDILANELGWRDYGGKHYESIITRFFQSYILPIKFKIDKRRAHYSVLIMSNQLTRVEAMGKLKEPTFDPQLLEEDRKYVIKKFGLTEESFDEIMKAPIKNFTDYPNSSWAFMPGEGNFFYNLKNVFKSVGIFNR